jgi:DNA-binding transcriptional ArsR family regulator
MSTRPATSNAAGNYQCTVCGREFSRKQGLGRHMSETHGRTTTRAAAAKRAASKRANGQTAVKRTIETSEVEGTIRDQLRELAAPLSEKRKQIDRRLDALAREAHQLRADRADIDAVLKRLDPSSQPKPSTPAKSQGNQARAERQHVERVEALREHLEQHADELREGFTSNQLVEEIKASGGKAMTTGTLRPALEALRDAGIVRADRVTRGGGMRYQLVMNGDQSNG